MSKFHFKTFSVDLGILLLIDIKYSISLLNPRLYDVKSKSQILGYRMISFVGLSFEEKHYFIIFISFDRHSH